MIDRIETGRLVLDPLVERHARDLFAGLSDPELYTFIDDERPASLAALAERYRRWELRRSPDGTQLWLNWAVRDATTYAGYVQATVIGTTAELAYVMFRAAWGHGYAREAVSAMMHYLDTHHAIDEYVARIDARNARSIALIDKLGFVRIDGEVYRRARLTGS